MAGEHYIVGIETRGFLQVLESCDAVVKVEISDAEIGQFPFVEVAEVSLGFHLGYGFLHDRTVNTWI